MRPYPNVPIWMRPTDWEVLPYCLRDNVKKWNDKEIKVLLLYKNKYMLKDIAKKSM